jgi:hypothetical protein
MDPATVQTVRIKASASLCGSGKLLGGAVSLAGFFRSGRGERERGPRSEIPASAVRRCRRRCTLEWSG